MADREFRIESDIPYPGESKSVAGRPPRFPFHKLDVGQSFFVASSHENFSAERQLAHALYKARETMGHDFRWVRADGGFRIFRLAGTAETRRHRRANGVKEDSADA
jgi:hypothetical protein